MSARIPPRILAVCGPFAASALGVGGALLGGYLMIRDTTVLIFGPGYWARAATEGLCVWVPSAFFGTITAFWSVPQCAAFFRRLQGTVCPRCAARARDLQIRK